MSLWGWLRQRYQLWNDRTEREILTIAKELRQQAPWMSKGVEPVSSEELSFTEHRKTVQDNAARQTAYAKLGKDESV